MGQVVFAVGEAVKQCGIPLSQAVACLNDIPLNDLGDFYTQPLQLRS